MHYGNSMHINSRHNKSERRIFDILKYTHREREISNHVCIIYIFLMKMLWKYKRERERESMRVMKSWKNCKRNVVFFLEKAKQWLGREKKTNKHVVVIYIFSRNKWKKKAIKDKTKKTKTFLNLKNKYRLYKRRNTPSPPRQQQQQVREKSTQTQVISSEDRFLASNRQTHTLSHIKFSITISWLHTVHNKIVHQLVIVFRKNENPFFSW